jgi:hypothetical protein
MHSFVCDNCGKEALEGYVGIGAFCSDTCNRRLMIQESSLQRELLLEHVDDIPEDLDLQAFERFVYKLALHALRDMPKTVRKRISKERPILLRPDELSMVYKATILKHVPGCHIKFKKSRGNRRYYYGGTCEILFPIPRTRILRAVFKTGILKPYFRKEAE